MERLDFRELIADLRKGAPSDEAFAQRVAEACASRCDRADLSADPDPGAAIRAFFELD